VPSVGIQLPKRQSQSIGELTVCIVLPSPAVLPVKEESLIEAGWLSRYSTEPDSSALLSMKVTPMMEMDSMKIAQTLRLASTTPPCCGCEEGAG